MKHTLQVLIRKAYLVAVTLLLIPGTASACRYSGDVPRSILALYDGDRVSAPRFTLIHRHAELALNHLGYRLIYRDISEGLPEMPDMPVAATISWFDAPVGDPAALAAWLAAPSDVCGETPALLVFGETGLTESVATTDAGSAYLSRIGLTHAGGDVALGAFSFIESVDDVLVGTETAFDMPIGPHAGLIARNPAESHFRVMSGDVAVDLLVLPPRAAYAASPVLLRDDPRGGALLSTDILALFDHALARPAWPVPDPTTLSGRRILFATVDSEGWLTRLPARQFGDQPPLASEVLLSDLITPYPDLPVSVAVLVGDVDPAIAGMAATRGREVAELLFAQPHVQPATTGVTMIRDWGFFAAYDRQTEEEVLASGTRQGSGGGIVGSAVQTLGDAFVDPAASALDITPFAPRKYAGLAFDLTTETVGAITTVDAMTPEASPTPLFVWSGNAMPFPAAIAEVAAAGAANLGGGGGMATDARPSLSQLWPLGLETEAGLQVYDALSGDVAYTSFWATNLSGYQALGQTLERTESPRRLKPIQISFAARSAMDFATRSAVRQNLELARSAEVTPITAARYTEAVAGFGNARIVAEGAGTWRIKQRGGIETVRFDGSAAQVVDMTASDGVIGARRKGPALYVALNPDTPAPRIALVDGDAPSGMLADGTAPALVQARAEILSLDRSACMTRATLVGFGDAEAEWLGAPDRNYDVTLYDEDGVTRKHWEQVTTDATGRMAVRLPLPPGRPAAISIADGCRQE